MNEAYESKFLDDLNANIGIVHRVCNIYFQRGSAEREDVYQEIMYQLWKAYPGFKKQSKISTWMYRVALNTAISVFRKKKRTPENEQLSENHTRIADHDDAADRDAIGEMYKAIATLPDIDKAIVMLSLDEHSYDEIAEITGITKANVSVRLFRCKKVLEARMKNI